MRWRDAGREPTRPRVRSVAADRADRDLVGDVLRMQRTAGNSAACSRVTAIRASLQRVIPIGDKHTNQPPESAADANDKYEKRGGMGQLLTTRLIKVNGVWKPKDGKMGKPMQTLLKRTKDLKEPQSEICVSAFVEPLAFMDETWLMNGLGGDWTKAIGQHSNAGDVQARAAGELMWRLTSVTEETEVPEIEILASNQQTSYYEQFSTATTDKAITPARLATAFQSPHLADKTRLVFYSTQTFKATFGEKVKREFPPQEGDESAGAYRARILAMVQALSAGEYFVMKSLSDAKPGEQSSSTVLTYRPTAEERARGDESNKSATSANTDAVDEAHSAQKRKAVGDPERDDEPVVIVDPSANQLTGPSSKEEEDA